MTLTDHKVQVTMSLNLFSNVFFFPKLKITSHIKYFRKWNPD